MHAHGLASTRYPRLRLLLAGAGSLLLAACGGGGGGINIGTGSSSGGSNAVLAGTYTKPNTSTRTSDSSKIFGAVDSLGNGYFADLGGSSRAVFAFASASQNGQLNGNFAAYAANGSNLGNGTALQQGNLGGTVASSSNVTTANVSYSNTAAGFTDSATLVLDHPVLAQTSLASAAGTYPATLGNAAIASTALFNLLGQSYTTTIAANGTFTLATTGCGNLLSGTAAVDQTYNIYDLHLSGNCSGTTVTLDGLAVYLPAGSASPLDGSTLAQATLLVELSDFLNPGNGRALALVATKSP